MKKGLQLLVVVAGVVAAAFRVFGRRRNVRARRHRRHDSTHEPSKTLKVATRNGVTHQPGETHRAGGDSPSEMAGGNPVSPSTAVEDAIDSHIMFSPIPTANEQASASDAERSAITPQEHPFAAEIAPAGTGSSSPASISSDYNADDVATNERTDGAQSEDTILQEDGRPIIPDATPARSEKPGAETTPVPGGIAPIRRGGGPRGPRAALSSRPSEAELTRPPELICRRVGQRFDIGFDTEGSPALRLFENDQPIAVNDGFGRVRSLGGRFEWSNDDATRLSLVLPNVLVFRLSAGGHQGRRTERLTPGLNLIVAPNTHGLEVADEYTLTARPGIGIEGYRAWEIVLATDAQWVRLNREGGSTTELAMSSSTRLSILGEAVGVSDIDVPIFGAPPRLDGIREGGLIRTIVVGREESPHRSWRRELLVDAEFSTEFERVLTEGGFGWYFVRAYRKSSDDLWELAWSDSFWLVPGLGASEVEPLEPLPIDGKHHPIEVFGSCPETITVAEAFVVEFPGKRIATLPLHRTRGSWSLRVSSDVICDAICLRIQDASHNAVTLRLPIRRIWWEIGENRRPTEWGTSIEKAPPRDFWADSKRTLWIRSTAWALPTWLSVGFADTHQHPVPFKTNEHVASYRLGDLYDDLKETRHASANLCIRVAYDDGEPAEALVARMVPAFACRLCAGFGCDNRSDIEQHIQERHAEQVVAPLNDYDEIAVAYNKRNPGAASLPKAIHKCAECTAYYPVEDWREKQSQSIAHMYSCPQKPKDKSNAGFTPIRDMNVIRKSSLAHIVSQVGEVNRCCLCSEVIFGARSTALKHALTTHKRALYDAS